MYIKIIHSFFFLTKAIGFLRAIVIGYLNMGGTSMLTTVPRKYYFSTLCMYEIRFTECLPLK